MPQKTMTAQEACEALGISLSTLRRRISAGELTPMPKAPGQKRPYRLNFRRADVEALAKEFGANVSGLRSEI